MNAHILIEESIHVLKICLIPSDMILFKRTTGATRTADIKFTITTIMQRLLYIAGAIKPL